MTRIIGGSAGGRRLRTPPGSATRPTSDRVREALFSALEARCGSLSGLAFLDLYAGSGAVGLEAWSRGADPVTLVEQDRRTAALVRRNAADLSAAVRVLAAPVAAVLREPPGTPYDLVFADPPYPMPEQEVTAALVALVGHGWLAPEALVVVERSARGPGPTWPAGLVGLRSKSYGETALHYAEPVPGPSPRRSAARPAGR